MRGMLSAIFPVSAGGFDYNGLHNMLHSFPSNSNSTQIFIINVLTQQPQG
jgi:hypothetical protein